tara:strand:- start:407 stop:1513 length:1107 start_codon:yes stop_codon:yes gene_type:complete
LNKKNIFICCTEQSGENICYNIVSRLNLKDINIDGVCGSRTSKFLKNKYFDISDFKSIGLIEVLISIPKYLKMINFLKKKIIEKNYDLVICIDSPDFNFYLAKSLRKKRYSNKIIQIVAPSVWAWRSGRAKKFSKLFNEIFLLFDFEKKYFEFPNFKSTFIGHPIFHIKKRKNKSRYKYIAFLPGSRENEINKLFDYFNNIEEYIYKNNLKFKIFIPTLPHLRNLIDKKIIYWKTETVISDEVDNFDTYYDEVFLSITCSGTASLEIAKRNIPQIVIYKLNYISLLILKMLTSIKFACILNIIEKKMIIPELINSNLTSYKLLNLFKKMINDKDFRNDQIQDINRILPKIESNNSPYEISSKRILELI